MRPARNAFNEVRSILGKLDESISRARRQRLGEDLHPPHTPQPTPHSRTQPPQAEPPVARDQGEQPVSARRARYGKARPLREAADGRREGTEPIAFGSHQRPAV